MFTSHLKGALLHHQRPQAAFLDSNYQPDRTRTFSYSIVEAAHKKGGGSSKNGRDSNAQRRGVKVYGGQPVKAGGIIIRQVGSTVHPGPGVKEGKDHTLFAITEGIVVFKKNKYVKQVTVVDFDSYEKPEGCKVKEGSRKMRRKQQYSTRKVSVAAAAVVTP